MKKYNVSLAGLLLFFATGAAIGMGNQNLEVILKNDTQRAIKVNVEYINEEKGSFMLQADNQQTIGIQGIKAMSIIAEGSVSPYLSPLFDAMNAYYKANCAKQPVKAIVKIMAQEKTKNELAFIIHEIDWVDLKTNKTVITSVTPQLVQTKIFSITKK